MDYQLDSEMFLYEFKKVVEMIVGDRFLRVHCIAFIIYVCVSFTSLLMGWMVSFGIAKSYVSPIRRGDLNIQR